MSQAARLFRRLNAVHWRDIPPLGFSATCFTAPGRLHHKQLMFAEPTASDRLHTVHEEEKPFEIELSWICEASNGEFRRVPGDIVAEADRLAKAAMEDSDMYIPFFAAMPILSSRLIAQGHLRLAEAWVLPASRSSRSQAGAV